MLWVYDEMNVMLLSKYLTNTNNRHGDVLYATDMYAIFKYRDKNHLKWICYIVNNAMLIMWNIAFLHTTDIYNSYKKLYVKLDLSCIFIVNF